MSDFGVWFGAGKRSDGDIHEEPIMKPRDNFLELSRRAMLSAFATLPGLPPLSALAQTAMTDPLPACNATAAKNAISIA